MSKQFNYYKADAVYGNLFFQLPKVLMYGERYKHLSSDAKLAYMVLKDRLDYSLRNNWIDEAGNVYFIYPNSELQQMFDCHNQKVIKIKRELEAVNILQQRRMGFNAKTGRNEPNRLYLGNLEVLATDVYLRMPKEAASTDKGGFENVNFTPPFAGKPSPVARENVNLRPTHGADLATKVSGSVNFTPDLDKDIPDTNRDDKETSNLDFASHQYSLAHRNLQNQDLMQHASQFLTDERIENIFLNSATLELLGKWCTTPKQMHTFIGIILNAKRQVEKDYQPYGVCFILDEPELQGLMANTIRRYFNVIRTEKIQVNNYNDYLFGTMKNMFSAYWNTQHQGQAIG